MSKEDFKDDSTSVTAITQETDIDQLCQKDNALLFSISMTLLQIVTENHSKPSYKSKLKSQSKQIFTSKALPKISLSDYLHRIIKYTKIEDSTVIMALIYIDRICRKRKIMLTEYNVYRILFSSLMASIKYNEEKFYSNIFYAKIGGVEVKQLNLLEYEFFIGINFDLFVDTKMYQKYEMTLIKNSFSK